MLPTARNESGECQHAYGTDTGVCFRCGKQVVPGFEERISKLEALLVEEPSPPAPESIERLQSIAKRGPHGSYMTRLEAKDLLRWIKEIGGLDVS